MQVNGGEIGNGGDGKVIGGFGVPGSIGVGVGVVGVVGVGGL